MHSSHWTNLVRSRSVLEQLEGALDVEDARVADGDLPPQLVRWVDHRDCRLERHDLAVEIDPHGQPPARLERSAHFAGEGVPQLEAVGVGEDLPHPLRSGPDDRLRLHQPLGHDYPTLASSTRLC